MRYLYRGVDTGQEITVEYPITNVPDEIVLVPSGEIAHRVPAFPQTTPILKGDGWASKS